MPRNPDKTDYSGGLPDSFDAFLVIEDHRTGGNKKHHFGEVLFMAITGLLCGMNGFADIEEFCEVQIDWFRKWITLPNGVPRAQTFSNIFQMIDPDQFNQCLIKHLGEICPKLQRQVIALDGKKLRGSHGLKVEAAHAVSAWAVDKRLTLAQEFVEEKSNEIKAIPKLLELLDLEGHLVTIDAMGTQTEIAQAIVDKGADYLLALKGNQGNLHKEVIDYFDFALRQLDLKKAKGWSVFQEVEKSHGRITTRNLVSTNHLAAMAPEIRDRWPDLKSLIVVESDTVICKSSKQCKPEKRYYISSYRGTAAEFQKAIRSHWGIENQCHWILDTAFREDHNQTYKGNAAKNLGTARRIVMNILSDDTGLKKSTPKKRFHALMNIHYRERLLSLA
jgi:predicted transposase YbfD/YdcC